MNDDKQWLVSSDTIWWHRLSRVASLLLIAFALALYLLIATGAVSAWHYAVVAVALVAGAVLGIGEARGK